MKNKIIILFLLAITFKANAAIRVYNPQTGEQQSIKVLEQNGAFTNEFQELTEEKKKNLTMAELRKYMQQVPDSHRPIENQLIKNLGTVVYFTDLESLSKKQAKVMNSVMEIKNVRVKFYIKEISSNTAKMLMAVKLAGEFNGKLSTDYDERNARRLHVSSYPQMIYIAPDKSRAFYSGTSGGVMALKIKLGEIETILNERKKQEQERKRQQEQAKQEKKAKAKAVSQPKVMNGIRFN